jgi:prepilin-type N-terminal cleavage/methylation domain-containing protein
MQARGKNQRGFSLIELLTVMVVITILAGWAVMGTGGFSTASKANAAMGIVVTELRQARQLAITSRRNVLVTITPPNQIQLAIETLPGEAPAQPISPRYLNDNAKDGMQFTIFNSLPDTPMGFGNAQAINFTSSSGAAGGLFVLFTASGSFVGTTAASNFSSVGNSNLVNASIFLGKPGDDRTARAITVLGGTGRVRSFTWDGLKWEE